MDLENLEWISVEERLPDEGVHVWVLGVTDDSVPVCYADGEDHSNDPRRPMMMWTCKRTKKDQYTDGNGFLRIYPYGQFVITHWFPIPKLDGKEIYETLPE